VRSMRRIFARMETIQKEFWVRLKISPLDIRLKRSREETLTMFERAWALGTKQGIIAAEEDIASLYAHCLAKVISLAGGKALDQLMPCDERIIRLLEKDWT
jgi:hypothetical protein